MTKFSPSFYVYSSTQNMYLKLLEMYFDFDDLSV